MITIPFKALEIFYNDTVTMTSAKGRDEFVKPFTLSACVMECDPYSTDNGFGPDTSKPTWTVMLSRDELKDHIPVVGSIILQGANHPRLYVKSVHPNGDTVWLDCTSTEAV